MVEMEVEWEVTARDQCLIITMVARWEEEEVK